MASAEPTANPMPRILVLLATYNGIGHLDAQLRSLLWQQDVVVAIVARDDGSTDETPRLLSDYAKADPGRVFVMVDELPRGGTAAVNFFRLLTRCPDLATFDYVAFADQDDFWFPDKLAAAVARLRATGAAGYSSDLLAHDQGRSAAWMIRKSAPQRPRDYLFQGASAGCTYVLTREGATLARDRLAATDPADWPTLSHDWTIYAILRSHGLGWTTDLAAHLVYRQHGANQFGALPGLRGLWTRLRMSQGGWYRAHILWLRQVLKGSPDELQVLAAVQRFSWRDRLWLAGHASEFRRTRRDVRLLQLALLGGQL